MNLRGTEGSFGYEWDIYREIIPLHQEQFLGWITPVGLDFFRGKRFLDAGCGIGRNSLWPLKAGAQSAYAFDFDERTINAARANLAEFVNCEVGFESIYELRRKEEFDVAFCIGVLHHLSEPRRAVENLATALKVGGLLILWVYAYEGNERYLTWFDPFRRWLSSRMPISWARMIAIAATAILKIYLNFPHRSPYLNLLKKRSFRHMEAMVFDQMLPHISKYYRREEVLDLLRGLPVELVHITHTHEMSWTLVARKV